jgi:hypothetical protein
VPLHGNDGKKVDKFVLTSAPEQLKVVVTLTGDSITSAVSRHKNTLDSFDLREMLGAHFHFEQAMPIQISLCERSSEKNLLSFKF